MLYLQNRANICHRTTSYFQSARKEFYNIVQGKDEHQFFTASDTKLNPIKELVLHLVNANN